MEAGTVVREWIGGEFDWVQYGPLPVRVDANTLCRLDVITPAELETVATLCEVNGDPAGAEAFRRFITALDQRASVTQSPIPGEI